MNRKSWIDVVRGIGIILVIIGHCHRPDILLKMIQSFHMPLFFILSGYLFRKTSESTFAFIKHKWRLYIKPYIILAVLNYAICLFDKYLEMGICEKWKGLALRYLIGLAYSRGTWYWMPNCSPIWFLTAIFAATVLFAWIMKTSKVQQYVLIGLCVLLAWIFCSIDLIKLPWNMDSAIWGVPFMYFGYVLKDCQIMERAASHKGSSTLLAVCLFGIGGVAGYINPVDYVSMDSVICGNVFLCYGSALCISTGLLLVVYLWIPKCKVLECYGRNTIVILGFNYVVNTLVYDIWNVMFQERTVPGEWLIQCFVQIVLLGLLAYAYQQMKRRRSWLGKQTA